MHRSSSYEMRVSRVERIVGEWVVVGIILKLEDISLGKKTDWISEDLRSPFSLYKYTCEMNIHRIIASKQVTFDCIFYHENAYVMHKNYESKYIRLNITGENSRIFTHEVRSIRYRAPPLSQLEEISEIMAIHDFNSL